MRTTRSQQKPRVGEYVFNCFMQDEPGILSRCTGIMAARGYNIDSLVVSKTEVEGLSRMTLTLKGEKKTIIQAQKQLEDLTQVWAVVDLTDSKVVEREILLAKVSLVGPEFIVKGSSFQTPRSPVKAQQEAASSSAETSATNQEDLYELTIEANKKLAYLKELVALCHAKIVNVGAEAAIVEMCAKSERIDLFIKMLEPFGIFESARSGRMVMSSIAKLSFFERDEPSTKEESENDIQDLSNLPPS
ncbi:putative acetolactate synthase small subunit [Smittium culicis]|uniref:Putative acetolactate synthase small subunit n=2 Tax=Smittium culicis TaxID=133412 RepID=A0A1R1XCK1_9FUNG|nr:putative acetolactate synthase small subunit [Smittium culicis]